MFNVIATFLIQVIDENATIEGPSESESHPNSRFVNANLPTGCNKANAWRRNYIPTYTAFVAAYRDPWVVEDEDAIAAMQLAWNAVFINRISGEDIPHTVTLNQAVFCIVRFPFHRPNSFLTAFRQTNASTNGVLPSVRRPLQSLMRFSMAHWVSKRMKAVSSLLQIS
jgi:hypothetical protein